VPAADQNWSEELELLHEESSETHFIDIRTRRAMLRSLGTVPHGSRLLDLGCSSGYLVEDLRRAYPHARLAGIDVIASGLRRMVSACPGAAAIQADAVKLPIESSSLDGVLSANLLEHVREDVEALREIHRVLRPGARCVAVVPASPATYDYYDRYLRHERRYGRGELRRKAVLAGLTVLDDGYLAALVYPAFWSVKKYHRLRFDRLDGDELAARVAGDVASTRDSRAGHLLMAAETLLERWGLRLPFGVRELIVVERRAA
jgi:SAM-dependent methyltransferase